MIFKSRQHAGTLLAEKLTSYKTPDAIVLGLARGGIITASVVSSQLHIPLDVLVVKKMASSGDPELAIGAVAPDGVSYIDWKFAHRLGIDEYTINKELMPNLTKLILERTLRYRRGKKPIALQGKTVILVDDGVATGATMQVAVRWVKNKHAKKIVIAIPIAPQDFYTNIQTEVDDVIILETPSDFHAVGQFYEEFPQISDREVIQLLK